MILKTSQNKTRNKIHSNQTPDELTLNRNNTFLNKTTMTHYSKIQPNQSMLDNYGLDNNSSSGIKTKGFINFGLQMSRPDISGANAHEKRFVPFDVFPNSYSKTKHSPSVQFEKCLSRNDKMYRTNMTEVRIELGKQMQDPRLESKGILQFGKMSLGKSSDELVESDKIKKHRAKINKLSGFNQNITVKEEEFNSQLKDHRKLRGFLSIGKLGVTNIVGKGLIDSNYMDSDYRCQDTSMLYLKKDFRVDPRTKRKVGGNEPSSMEKSNKVRSTNNCPLNFIGLTFNQLLAKYGYIEDESMTKKERIRDWHIKTVEGDSDASN
ncbi:UNKNOWN [Stylonychia lemnae]|uniref:Uncharacterized protein n=1 Tax=Stylonychia lemnae TaxID=5949 RepID=A0A078B9J5_STYLE|nr:UNKNOWN [Stylonychia lemnae]|eukprot:CDW89917.1 UNKNOWN [Stylonychia lemnae]